MQSILLSDLVTSFNLKPLNEQPMDLDIPIYESDVIRPGLQLAGHFLHFGPDHIQVIGNMEYAFLASCAPGERQRCIDKLFATGIPCLILARSHQPMPEMQKAAVRYGVPLLGSDEATGSLVSAINKQLNVDLAERISIHGVLVEVYGEGILILGDSGVGKSETALEIVKRGHRLIADDLVEIRKVSDTTLLGMAPEIIRYLIEIRGVGILDIKELYGVSSVKLQEKIDFVINLEYWDEDKLYERFGLANETTDILGIELPSLTIPVRPGRNLAVIVEVAAINFRQKSMGYDAAQALARRVFGQANEETDSKVVEQYLDDFDR